MIIATSKDGFSLENGLMSYDRFEIRLHGDLMAYYDAHNHDYKVVADWMNAGYIEMMLHFVNENTSTIDKFVHEHEYDVWTVEQPSKNVSSLDSGKRKALRGEKDVEIWYDQRLFGWFNEDSKKITFVDEGVEISFEQWKDFQRLREYLYNFQLN